MGASIINESTQTDLEHLSYIKEEGTTGGLDLITVTITVLIAVF